MRNQVAGGFAGDKDITAVELGKDRLWQMGWGDYRTGWNGQRKQGERVKNVKKTNTEEC